MHPRRRGYATHRTHRDGRMAVGMICNGQRFFPHEFFSKTLLAGKLKPHYQIDPKDENEDRHHRRPTPLFLFRAGEDSTLGIMFCRSFDRPEQKCHQLGWLYRIHDRAGSLVHRNHADNLLRLNSRFAGVVCPGIIPSALSRCWHQDLPSQYAVVGLLLPDQ